MKWKFLIILIFLFFHPVNVEAQCYSDEIVSERVRILNLASNLDITSFYNEDNSNINFSIRISNLHPDFYLIEKKHNLMITYDAKRLNYSEIIISNYKSGERLIFEIKPKNTRCINDIVLHTRYVTLPYYNKFYSDPLCSKISDYHLCKKWGQVTPDYEEFKKDVGEYIKKMEEIKNNGGSLPGDNKIDRMLDLIEKYYIPVLGSIIVLGSLIIFKESKRNEFGF